MRTRVLSGLVMAPLLVVVFFGGWPLYLATMLVAGIGIWEFYQSFNKIKVKPSRTVALVSLLALYSIFLLKPEMEMYQLWFFGVVLLSLLLLFKIEKRELADAMATITGILYIGYFSFHILLIDQVEGYGLFVWLVLITAFGTDSMAYFTGYAIGKHKLCPKISPKKTIEGAVGGLVGSMLFSGLFLYFIMPHLVLHGIVIGLLCGITSQLGDLTASIFKRKLGIKDYGHLIPGHGGILDRFDSVLFTAPTVYYYLVLIIL